MIEIRTSAGVSLDLDPESEFEIEYDNPMLEDSHIPVPFSTSIAFPASLTNNKAFGYLPALMLEPSVKELSATILAGGVDIADGFLTYDSIDEDGKVNYTFAGLDIENDHVWGQKIHERTIHALSFASFTELNAILASLRSGSDENVIVPTMINKSSVDDTVYPVTGMEKVDQDVKYQNWPFDDFRMFTPAIRVKAILSEVLSNAAISPAIDALYDHIFIVAQYKPWSATYKGFSTSNNCDVAEGLPDMSVIDLLKNMLKLFCASLYRDGNKYRILSAEEVLASTEIVDWDRKVSDVFSSSKEDVSSYVFNYANDDDESSKTVSTTDEDGNDSIIDAASLSAALLSFGAAYQAVRYVPTGDVYSGRMQVISGDEEKTAYFADMLLHDIPKKTTASADSDESSFDNTTDLELVSCVPDHVYGTINGAEAEAFRIAPVIESATVGDERDEKAYVGIAYNRQLCDRGRVFSGQWQGNDCPDEQLEISGYGTASLAPADLYGKFHSAFASWIGKTRQVVTADLDLDIEDISSFRIWRKVTFRGRPWLVKKMTMTLRADRDYVECKGDFISL